MNNRMKAERYLIDLLKYMLNGRVPKQLVLEVPMSNLYHLARKHSVERIAFEAVKQMGSETKGQTGSQEIKERQNWDQEVFKKWQKRCLVLETQSAIQQEEYHEIVQNLKDKDIKVLPLKGCMMKEMYPDPAYRQMGDIDLLIPANMADMAKTVMEEMGYETEHFDESNHDTYIKRPWLYVELHRELFYKEHQFYPYYKNVWESLKPVDEELKLYTFSWEDFYLYMLAHFSKHYYSKGSGIRSIMDIYVFQEKHGKN